MLIRILLIISLIVAGYKGLQHWGIIKSDSNKEKKEFNKLIANWNKKSKTTNEIKGKIKNINKVRPEDLATQRKERLQSKFPDVSQVFGADNYKWVSVLKEEEFTILRELKFKLDQGQDIVEDDLKKLYLLESKNIIKAIRDNNPQLLNKSDTNEMGRTEIQDEIESEPELPIEEESPQNEYPTREQDESGDSPVDSSALDNANNLNDQSSFSNRTGRRGEANPEQNADVGNEPEFTEPAEEPLPEEPVSEYQETIN